MAGDASPRLISYDVFISFRGEDTRHTFVGNLHEAFRRNGINAFFDDEKLKRGRDISIDLFKAIEESRISVIVFSKDYASSTWCLRELAKIRACMKENKQLVWPVFYKVDPSDVRHQKNSYKEAMTAQENRFGKDSEKVQEWRSALYEVASLKGDHFRDGYDYEFKFIEHIVKEVSKNLPPKPLPIVDHLVGLESRVETAKSLLDMSNDNSVCMLGIYGAGGIGKTALAKALYNKIAHQFEGASFLSDVREKSGKGNVEELQKTLLSEIMREKIDTMFGNTSEGMKEIKNKLYQKKVLLVLDDVDNKKRLEELAGGLDWFGSGSRIIITTRDKDVLDRKVKKTFKMTELNDEDSLELFCWHAFEMSHPATSFKDVSSRAVGYAKGLPLALKVIGSNLSTISLEDWESTLEEYERIPNQEIQKVLKVSYDSLEDYAKYVFLDIACFFKGEAKEYVREILDACEYNAKRQIGVLVKKSLITVDHGYLKMHDLIQDMGREIVRQEAKSKSVGKRSRLWFYKDVIKVLTENSGSRRIEGIMLDPPHPEEVIWDGDAFKKMTDLRILIVRNTRFSSGPTYLPNDLRLLHWEEYPSEALPQNFSPEKIVVFDLPKSRLTLEEPLKKFSCLTYMDFSDNQSITEVPDMSEVQNLKELRLNNCKSLIKVHESVGSLNKLVHFSAQGCAMLRSFLPRMFLPSLKTLDLNLCVRLEHFPDIVGKMNEPLKIYMINTAIKELPDSVRNLIGLDCIEMPSSKRLRDVPSSLFTLPNFVVFKIGGCSQVRESFRKFLDIRHSVANGGPALQTLHFRNAGLTDEDLCTILKCFPNMEDLKASENNFVSLPPCIEECIHLISLDVSGCRKLQKIPKCTSLTTLDVNGCVKLQNISELPLTRKVDARYCVSFTRETSDMLWYQVLKQIHKLEIVMPKTEIPEWFDFWGKEGTPRFWARGKFPIFALALVLEGVNGMAKRSRAVRRQLVDLQLFVNGQCVPRKGYYNFSIAEDHVLLCDLRVMFSDEEWLGLNKLLKHDWNCVQVSYQSSFTLTCWGVYVYKQHSRIEDVEFMCPDPKYSDTAIGTPPLVRTPSQKQKQDLHMIESLRLQDVFDEMLNEVKDLKEDYAIDMFHNGLMNELKDLSMQAGAVLESNRPSASGSGSQLRVPDTTTLEWLLQKIQEPDTEGEADGAGDEADGAEGQVSSIFIHGGLALLKLKKPIDLEKYRASVCKASSSRHDDGSSASEVVQGLDPQQQELVMAKFREGMSQGLGVAKLSFPTLDVESTINAAFKKGNRVIWEPSQFENNDDVRSLEMKAYMEGIVNGLLEARLSFPTLDIKTTTSATLSKAYGGSNGLRLDIQVGKLKGEPPTFAPEEASSSHHDDGSSASEITQGLDPQQELLMDIFVDGMGQGLRLAKLSFPTLDIDATMIAALNKPNQVLWERSFSEVKNNGDAPSSEMKAYMEGVINGLIEARLSFPTLDIPTTMNAAFRRAFEGTSLATKASKFFWYTREKGSPSTSGNPGSSDQSVMQQYDHPHPLPGELPRVRQQILESNILSLTLVHGEWKGNGAPIFFESSSFPHEGSSETEEVQGLEPQQWLTVLNGMSEGLREAKLSFPALDIDTTINAILNKGIQVRWPPEDEDKGYEVPPMELNLYLQGMINGLKEAQLSFPTLDIMNTIISSSNKAASKYEGTSTTEAQSSMFQEDMDSTAEKVSTSGYRGGSKSKTQSDRMDKADCKLKAPLVPLEESDCTAKEASTSGYGGSLALAEGDDNPLLQALMTMGEPSLEPDHQAQGNLYGKLKMEHQALRKKFEDFENETAAPEKDGVNFPFWKNQYDEMVEKFNTLSAEFLSVKHQRENNLSSNTTNAQAPSELSAIRKGGKGVIEYQKLGDAWKGRAEELRRLYDVGIEGLKKSELFEDLMSAIYLEGLRDGLLEAQVSFLALHMDTAHSEEHIVETASDNQNHEETTVISGTPESDPPSTAPPSDFANYEEFASFLF